MFLFLILDLFKLCHSAEMNPNNGPRALQAEVIFDIRFYFARRVSENFKNMTVHTFQAVFDDMNDIIYIKKSEDKMQKNHKECDSEIITEYMPEMKENPLCPVESYREYISHLNPDCEFLWQRPITNLKTSVWYANCSIGDHTLSDYMKNLSAKVGLLKKYTNHNICVT